MPGQIVNDLRSIVTKSHQDGSTVVAMPIHQAEDLIIEFDRLSTALTLAKEDLAALAQRPQPEGEVLLQWLEDNQAETWTAYDYKPDGSKTPYHGVSIEARTVAQPTLRAAIREAMKQA